MKMMRESKSYFKVFDSLDQVEDKDGKEEDMHQSEIQRVSSTVCMREEGSDDSEEESECQGK